MKKILIDKGFEDKVEREIPTIDSKKSMNKKKEANCTIKSMKLNFKTEIRHLNNDYTHI